MSASPWEARLELTFQQRASRTVLAARRHRGPLVVQRPFYPEGGICHVYLVHPPGGIVGGDQLTLLVQAEPQSHALITTPAATRFYRAGPHPSAMLTQQLHVHDAALEWLPQETILFDGARAATCTQVHLHGDRARFLGWEVLCLGRPANGERFITGTLAQDFLLYCDDKPLLLDRLRLQGNSAALSASWGLAGLQAAGTLLMYPATDANLPMLRTLEQSGVRCALTRVDDVLVVRALADQAEPIRQLFTRIWLQLRPGLVGCAGIAPRIWAT
jgi:urease accessory protein